MDRAYPHIAPNIFTAGWVCPFSNKLITSHSRVRPLGQNDAGVSDLPEKSFQNT